MATVTELVGPAGSGKTLGVAGWLRRRAVTGSPAAAVTRWRTATGMTTAGELRALTAWDGAGREGVRPVLRVVIDNAERLGTECLGELERLLDERPEGLHVVVISRWDLALRRLTPVLLGAMCRVRGDALRLSDAEARRLVALHAPGCPRERVDALVEQARGWCAAVVLGARSAGTAGDGARPAPGPGATLLVGQEAFAGLRPRQRHVVLSVCRETTVTAAQATHLSGDPTAAAVLEELEGTGLLVERDRPPTGAEVFRVHPILLHVARRRMAEGGPEADRASAAVARAARADLADGRWGSGLRRTLDAGGCGPATEALARHGLAAVLSGDGPAVGAVVRRCAGVVDVEPRAWLAAAVERWWAGDAEAAGRWCDRLLTGGGTGAVAADALPARLLRVQLDGTDEDATAVAAASLAAPGRGDSPRDALVADLLGAAYAWAGDLTAAERWLARAVETARTHGCRALEADARGRLALTELLRGRPGRAVDLAARVLREEPLLGSPAHAAADAATARMDPWRHAAGPAPAAPQLGRDRVAAYVAQLTVAQRLAVRGHLTQAERALAVPLLLAPLPHRLAVGLLVHRALVAIVAQDVDTLAELGADLRGRGAAAEAALVDAFRSVCGGDLPAAATALRVAMAADEPLVAAVATVTSAQVLAARGDRSAARCLLAEAVRRAEHRRDALPLVGWVGHLVPLPALLADLPAGVGGAWAEHVARSARRHGTVSGRTVVASVTSGPAPGRGPLRPLLTVREQDVLAELARGATYADIATALVVSANTVKTHVGSLYAKLGAARRSEALATARTLGLV